MGYQATETSVIKFVIRTPLGNFEGFSGRGKKNALQ